MNTYQFRDRSKDIIAPEIVAEHKRNVQENFQNGFVLGMGTITILGWAAVLLMGI